MPSDRSENSIKNLLDDVKAKINDLEDELAKAKLFWEEEEQDLETKVDIAREDYLMFQNEISSKEKNLKIIQTQKEKIKQELSEVRNKSTFDYDSFIQKYKNCVIKFLSTQEN